MRIGQKLILGFVGIALLVGVVGYICVTNFRNVGETFRELKGDIVPGAIAMTEMFAATEHLAHHTLEYIFAEEEEEEESIFKGTRLQKLIQEGSIRDYDMTYRTKAGEEIPVSFSGSVMREVESREERVERKNEKGASRFTNDASRILGIVGIARDMREIKRLMEKEKRLAATVAAADAEHKRAAELEKAYTELRTTQEKLVQSEKLASVGRLAAGVAHEVNNPLAAILLGVQRMVGMMKKQGTAVPDDEAYLRIIQRMERSTHRAKQIVAGLLAFSRPTTLQLAPTDIHHVIEETLESLQDLFATRNVRVVKKFAVHPPTLIADGQQLSQVFTNLILNACDAMSQGGKLTIRTRLKKPRSRAVDKARKEGGKIVEIEFSDTGVGLSEEDLHKIFDPFFTTKETGKGVGLGLSISHGIVEQHSGAIEVRSEKGKGSTFVVRLPVGREHVER